MSLFIIATPIGNLSDISLHSLEVLKNVDLVLAEDTRESIKLLNHFNIKKPLLSYHQHSKINKINQIIDLLKKGKDLALVSDAGTPGISDPGNKLVAEVAKENIKVVPIPGASALVTGLSVSGFPTDKFIFLGFPPQKNKRKAFFDKALSSEYTVCFYESRYRILKTLKELKQREIVVCRELTKKFESIYRGAADDVIKALQNDTTKGEFVVILRGIKN